MSLVDDRDSAALRRRGRPLCSPERAAATVVAILVVAAALWLWDQLAAAVFLETIRAGFVVCFG